MFNKRLVILIICLFPDLGNSYSMFFFKKPEVKVQLEKVQLEKVQLENLYLDITNITTDDSASKDKKIPLSQLFSKSFYILQEKNDKKKTKMLPLIQNQTLFQYEERAKDSYPLALFKTTKKFQSLNSILDDKWLEYIMVTDPKSKNKYKSFQSNSLSSISSNSNGDSNLIPLGSKTQNGNKIKKFYDKNLQILILQCTYGDNTFRIILMPIVGKNGVKWDYIAFKGKQEIDEGYFIDLYRQYNSMEYSRIKDSTKIPLSSSSLYQETNNTIMPHTAELDWIVNNSTNQTVYEISTIKEIISVYENKINKLKSDLKKFIEKDERNNYKNIKEECVSLLKFTDNINGNEKFKKSLIDLIKCTIEEFSNATFYEEIEKNTEKQISGIDKKPISKLSLESSEEYVQCCIKDEDSGEDADGKKNFDEINSKSNSSSSFEELNDNDIMGIRLDNALENIIGREKPLSCSDLKLKVDENLENRSDKNEKTKKSAEVTIREEENPNVQTVILQEIEDSYGGDNQTLEQNFSSLGLSIIPGGAKTFIVEEPTFIIENPNHKTVIIEECSDMNKSEAEPKEEENEEEFKNQYRPDEADHYAQYAQTLLEEEEAQLVESENFIKEEKVEKEENISIEDIKEPLREKEPPTPGKEEIDIEENHNAYEVTEFKVEPEEKKDGIGKNSLPPEYQEMADRSKENKEEKNETESDKEKYSDSEQEEEDQEENKNIPDSCPLLKIEHPQTEEKINEFLDHHENAEEIEIETIEQVVGDKIEIETKIAALMPDNRIETFEYKEEIENPDGYRCLQAENSSENKIKKEHINTLYVTEENIKQDEEGNVTITLTEEKVEEGEDGVKRNLIIEQKTMITDLEGNIINYEEKNQERLDSSYNIYEEDVIERQPEKEETERERILNIEELEIIKPIDESLELIVKIPEKRTSELIETIQEHQKEKQELETLHETGIAKEILKIEEQESQKIDKKNQLEEKEQSIEEDTMDQQLQVPLILVQDQRKNSKEKEILSINPIQESDRKRKEQKNVLIEETEKKVEKELPKVVEEERKENIAPSSEKDNKRTLVKREEITNNAPALNILQPFCQLTKEKPISKENKEKTKQKRKEPVSGILKNKEKESRYKQKAVRIENPLVNKKAVEKASESIVEQKRIENEKRIIQPVPSVSMVTPKYSPIINQSDQPEITEERIQPVTPELKKQKENSPYLLKGDQKEFDKSKQEQEKENEEKRQQKTVEQEANKSQNGGKMTGLTAAAVILGGARLTTKYVTKDDNDDRDTDVSETEEDDVV